jgi:uncharacterized membrane protein
MQKQLRLVSKYLFLFCIGGLLYMSIEILYRGYTHWSMGILGGISFVSIGLINEILSWDTPLAIQALIGSIMITLYEFITGVILNIWLGLGIWDYSNLPFNILGQICLPFSIIWYFLSIVGICLDDFLRWKFFGEEKPRYKIF